ncbi:MAG: HlyD family type I secretion periplasmic adaptor subunit [Hyphomonadaceae bacterium]|nr:HlyD family type I secretion periplasmic adaptor subunit [Hyphomonadaceae bacterium]
MASIAMAGSGLPDSSGRTTSTRKYFLIGWSVIILVFGGLLAWSVFAPFEGAVLAQGTVGVESRHKAIQHLEGGIVAEITVRDGDRVEEGQLLIRLDGTPIRAQLDNVDARLVDLLAREARLVAERDEATQMSLREASPEILALPGLRAAEANQVSLLTARAEARRTEVSILTQRIAQLRETISGLTAEMNSKLRQAELIDDELVGLEKLLADGLAQRPQVLALQREKSNLLGQVDALHSEIAATQVRIGEANLEILGLTEGFREDVISQLTEVQTEIAALLTERTAAADRLKRLDIRAPRAGLVLGSRTHTVGGVIAPGDPVMHIVPENDSLVTLVRVMPQDIDKIHVGQTARLRFSAFNQDQTPEVPATVRTISADTIQDPNTGMAYYEVSIELPTPLPLGEEFEVVPGMPVEAMLQTESRNVLSYLIKPLTDAMNRTFRE